MDFKPRMTKKRAPEVKLQPLKAGTRVQTSSGHGADESNGLIVVYPRRLSRRDRVNIYL